MAQNNNHLRFKEKLGYGLGDTASNFFFQTFNIFLLYYYTDVFGISAAAVGTMFFVTKLWDAVNDPLMGIIADRTQTRFGKFRPYLLWMAIPYGVLGYVMFANPDLSDSGKLVYAWVTYTLMMMTYTAINVPYSALMGVMTPSSQERTILSSYRFVCAFGGGLLISMLVRPLTQYFGAENEAQGFSTTMALFAVVSIALFWYTFATTKERVKTVEDHNSNLKHDLKILFLESSLDRDVFCSDLHLSQCGGEECGDGTLFQILCWRRRDSLFPVHGPHHAVHDRRHAGYDSWRCQYQALHEYFEKKTLMIWLSLLNAVSMVLIFLIPPDQYWTMMAVNIVGTFLVGPTPALVWAMYADVADYGEWKFGRRTTGLVFSAAQFAQKFGLTLGGGLSGWLLGSFGFVANMDQTDTSLLGIRLMFTVIPACFAMMNVFVLIFYNLSDTQVQQIEIELEERRSQRQQST